MTSSPSAAALRSRRFDLRSRFGAAIPYHYLAQPGKKRRAELAQTLYSALGMALMADHLGPPLARRVAVGWFAIPPSRLF
jgi:hypothetical protein